MNLQRIVHLINAAIHDGGNLWKNGSKKVEMIELDGHDGGKWNVYIIA
jgi:hypothetical protein